MWRRLRSLWPTLSTVVLLGGVLAALFSLDAAELDPLPELEAELHAAPPEHLSGLQQSIGHWQAASAEDRTAYLEWLSDTGLESIRRRSKTHIRARAEAAQVETATAISTIFRTCAFLSLLLLLGPLLVSRKRIPERARLWLHAAFSGCILFVTFMLLGAALEVFLSLSANVTRMADPQVALTDAAIDQIRADADRLLAPGEPAGLDSLPFGPAIGMDAGAYDHGFLSNLVENLRYFDPRVFEPAIRWTHRAWTLFGTLPRVVPILVALIFLLTMRPLVTYVVSMPYRAARGESRAARRAMGRALGFVGREVLSIAVLAVALVLMSLLVSKGSHHLSQSIVRVALREMRTTVDYFGHLGGPPDQVRLTIGTLALPTYVALTTLWTLFGLGLFAFWARRVTQLRFHRHVPLRAHGRFWRRGALAVLRLQWIPILVLWALLPWMLSVHEGPAPDAATALGRLMTTTLVLTLALVGAYLLFGGVGAVRTLTRFRPERTPPAPDFALRAVTVEDHAFLRRAHHQALQGAVVRTWGTWDEEAQDGFVDTWLARVHAAPGTLQVIEQKGRPIGYLEVREEPDVLFLASLVLVPRAQGRGVGSALVRALQEKAASAGRPLRLQVLTGNGAARRLYARLGFRTLEKDSTRIQMQWDAGGASPEGGRS